MARKIVEVRRFEKARQKRQQIIDAAIKHLNAQVSNECRR
jgi:hypothetical protein